MIPPGQQIHLFGTERGTTAGEQGYRCRIRGQGTCVHDFGGESSGWAKAGMGPPSTQKGEQGLEEDRSCSDGSFHCSRLANLGGCHDACGWGTTGTVLVGGAGDAVL